MTRKPYTTKTGLSQYRPIATEREVLHGLLGFCLACGDEAEPVEPDARKYRCESCGAFKVYGLEELAVMGLLILKGGTTNA